jgi:hypothetical protein
MHWFTTPQSAQKPDRKHGGPLQLLSHGYWHLFLSPTLTAIGTRDLSSSDKGMLFNSLTVLNG